jgi:precorrin-2 dehydrogenase/sirohydrochlorin ferrochelatase
MSYMVNLSLEGRAALVVGGGAIASRKAEDLLQAKAVVTVVAPEIGEEMVKLAVGDRVQVFVRPYRSTDIGNSFVVIAATDSNEVNKAVFQDAAARNVLVNVVDVPDLCTFTVPATVHRGNLTIAIATEGLSPAFSGILREELEGRYGAEYGTLVEVFGDLRKKMIADGWKGAAIREKLAEIYRGGVIDAIASGDDTRLREFLASHLAADLQHPGRLSE